MIGDIPIVTIIIGGILSLIVAIRIWAYESDKAKKREQEKEEYRKAFFAQKQREQEEGDEE